ncbi:hypothetical protein WN944_023667 [Citrus x changshan-huyou]|uniref:GRF-type domain-containing protein n=1 Tax=Citrus x changshan-huyou TaxID=2935761 RepID=A0AAP0N0K2_9ROSI
MSTSTNASSSSTHNRRRNLPKINGGIIKFYNIVCYCRTRAEIKVSESKTNPNKLYYSCHNDPSCGFFRWWKPSTDEAIEIQAALQRFEEEAVNDSASYNQQFDIEDFRNRFINIEGLLHQNRKYQITIIVITILVLIVLYYKE